MCYLFFNLIGYVIIRDILNIDKLMFWQLILSTYVKAFYEKKITQSLSLIGAYKLHGFDQRILRSQTCSIKYSFDAWDRSIYICKKNLELSNFFPAVV